MISTVVQSLFDAGYKKVVVVDDGSKDDGYNVVSKIPGVLLGKHLINRGQGSALQTAMEIAIDDGAEYIVHFDSDGQHQVEDIERLIQPLLSGEYDIALGSRFLKENDIPFKKRILLKAGILFTFFLSGIWLTDVHNGIRAMTVETAKKLSLKHDRFEHASEILDKVKSLNLRYKEIPVTIKYTEYSMAKGQSMFNSINIATKLIISKLRDV